MYIKVVQFTSTSKMQKEMLGAYLQTVWFPELIKLGALSCRYVSLDDTKAMMINIAREKLRFFVVPHLSRTKDVIPSIETIL